MVFAHGLVRASGEIVLRCSGVYKIGPPIPAGNPGMYTASMPADPPRRT